MNELQRETLNAICRSSAPCHTSDPVIRETCKSLVAMGFLRPVPMLVNRGPIKVAYEVTAAGTKADRAAQSDRKGMS